MTPGPNSVADFLRYFRFTKTYATLCGFQIRQAVVQVVRRAISQKSVVSFILQFVILLAATQTAANIVTQTSEQSERMILFQLIT